MTYEAPDFIKVVANVKDSFAGSPPTGCTYSRGFLQVEGQELLPGYFCGDTDNWIDTKYAMNCWIGNTSL